MQGHNGTFTNWAVEAQLVILWGREGLFSLELPRGSEFQAAVGPCPAASLSGGGQRVRDEAPCDTKLSAWVWLCLLGGTLKTVHVSVCVCVHKKYIYAGFSFKHVFVSQGLIFICCMSTRWQCSAEKMTSNLSMCLWRDCPIEGALAVY